MPTVAIDFDGTLHPYTNGWQGVGVVDDEAPHEDVEFFLSALVGAGCTLVVHSCRAAQPEGLIAIGWWLGKYDLMRYFDRITSEKPAAVVYLDDRAVRFTGDWFGALETILTHANGG